MSSPFHANLICPGGPRRTGLKNSLTGSLVDENKRSLARNFRPIYIMFEQDGLEDRTERCRGFTALNQVERVYLITHDVLDLPLRDRLHWDGNNRGNMVGPVAPLKWNANGTWTATVASKKDIMGKQGEVLVGGGWP